MTSGQMQRFHEVPGSVNLGSGGGSPRSVLTRQHSNLASPRTQSPRLRPWRSQVLEVELCKFFLGTHAQQLRRSACSALRQSILTKTLTKSGASTAAVTESYRACDKQPSGRWPCPKQEHLLSSLKIRSLVNHVTTSSEKLLTAVGTYENSFLVTFPVRPPSKRGPTSRPVMWTTSVRLSPTQSNSISSGIVESHESHESQQRLQGEGWSPLSVPMPNLMHAMQSATGSRESSEGLRVPRLCPGCPQAEAIGKANASASLSSRHSKK